MWQNTHSKTLVCLKGETPYPALTTGSFLYCKYGGHVYPINSGQPMLDPPKADAELLALTQETEIQPALVPLAQGASKTQNSSNNSGLTLIGGGKIYIGGNAINTVYCDAKTGELYVDLYEATAAFGGKYIPEVPFNLSPGIKNIFYNPFISINKDKSGKIFSPNGDMYIRYTLSSEKGTATATRYTADGKYAFAMFSSGYFQQDGKQLVKLDYIQNSMNSLGWGTDNGKTKEITQSPQIADAIRAKAIKVNNWLMAYSMPSAQGGRTVAPPASREELKKIVKKELGFTPEWYAPENVGGVQVNINVPVDNEQVNVGQGIELVDKDGRYWIAVGPTVMNPNHVVNSRITAEEMNYGAKADIKLEDINTGEIIYVYARIGDVKAHTGNGNITYPSGNTYQVTGDGIYQTGVSASQNQYLYKNADASIVEFMVKNSDFDHTNLTNYRLIELIVYD
jgi:hypothetical protein